MTTEAQLQQNVIELLTTYGYLTYHTYDSRRSEPGFPDLVAVQPRRGRVLFIELKGPDGRLGEAQVLWLTALAQAGADVHVVRPATLQAFARWVALSATAVASGIASPPLTRWGWQPELQVASDE